MLSKNRLHLMAVSAAALLGTLSLAAPASAASFGSYTCPFAQTSNYGFSNYGFSGYRFWHVIRPSAKQAPAPQTTAKTGFTPAPAPAPAPVPAPAPAGRTTGSTQATPAPKSTAPDQTATSAGLTAEEQQMLNLVNQERAKVGIAPLKADPQLTKLARLKSQDMINGHYFSHQSPTYGSPFDMMKNAGVSYRTAGENIAGNQSVPAAHTALMNSAGHRANILNAQFNYIGIGIVHGGQYGVMFTQQFVGR